MSQAAPGVLRNLDQPAGYNLGGLEALFFVPVDSVLSVPDTAGSTISSPVSLTPSGTWYQLVALLESLQYEEKPVPDQHGEKWKAVLKGVLAKDTPGLQDALEAMSRHRHLLLYRDANGYMKLVGSKQEPLSFQFGADPGRARRDRNERAFQFAGEITRSARFYEAAWSVSELGVQYQPTGGGSSGGIVLVKDPDGNLITSLTAGQTLVLDTAFAFTYSVE